MRDEPQSGKADSIGPVVIPPGSIGLAQAHITRPARLRTAVDERCWSRLARTTPKGWYVVTQHGRVLFDADIRRRLFFPDLDLF